MPRSRSWSLESMMRPCCPPTSLSSSSDRNSPDCRSIWSTSVVLPWSTWAMTATFLMSFRFMDRFASTIGLEESSIFL